MAQRLVRTICESCKAPHTVSSQCEQLGFDYELFKDRPVYEGKGPFGLSWIGVSRAPPEFLPLTDRIRVDVIGGRRLRSGARGGRTGMTDLRQAGRGEGTRRGETTMREVNRMTFWDRSKRGPLFLSIVPVSASACLHPHTSLVAPPSAVVPQAHRETGRGACVAQWVAAEGLRNRPHITDLDAFVQELRA